MLIPSYAVIECQTEGGNDDPGLNNGLTSPLTLVRYHVRGRAQTASSERTP
jgi:hypothetical protein